MPRKTYVAAIQEALAEEMRRDDRVFLIGEDVRIGVFPSTRGLHAEFGDKRVIDTPISELAVAGAGIGAAVTGLRPIVDLMFGTFLYLAFDQIANQAGAMRYMYGGQTKAPLVFMVQSGAGSSAGHHHSQAVHQFFMNMPQIKVILPSTPYDGKGLLKSAIRDDNPVIFLHSLSLGGKRGDVPSDEYLVPIGAADVKRAGSDVTICGVGPTVYAALEAAKMLAAEGVDAEVIDLRSLSPWDKQTVLESVAKTGRFVAVDESFPTCSAASEWAATVAEEAFSDLKAPVQRVTNQDVPMPFSPVLEKAVLPSAADVVAAARKTLT
ncbi:MAG: alpha-ketoacid dehydrogenase subunit beta [Chloroflexota bacterium]|nr:alpha-ketoacid dehydrogenase subunit beta [Chloroflexota bacterium]MDE2949614.1 alpha-ketoacid dehydrogenase subunit beta [Chloroflexota bacterium]